MAKAWRVALAFGFATCLGANVPPQTRPAAAPARTYGKEFEKSYAYAGPRTKETLERIKTALSVPGTRMAAVRELIDFAGPSAYQVGSAIAVYPDGSAEIRREATRVLVQAEDETTIETALESEDPILVYRGLWRFASLPEPARHLARLEGLAQGADETLRSRAVEVLGRFPGEAAFLREQVAREKSPYVLASTLLGNSAASVPSRFNDRIVALLADPDADVRRAAVGFISSNWISAGMRQMFVDGRVMEALLARALGDGPEAPAALKTFLERANAREGENLTDARAAEAWWKEHRHDWELARFPRWIRPNGGPVVAAVVTTGGPGEAPWEATIELRNAGTRPVTMDAGELAHVDWQLFRPDGSRFPLEPLGERASRWIVIPGGESVREPAGLVLPALPPGRYTLRGELTFTGRHGEGRPAGAEFYSVQLVLPAIVVEVGPQAGR